MTEIDPLVTALINLCTRKGGHIAVAEKAHVSAEGLLQIIKGTKLPSGNPRGVGPGLRAKLSAAYPGWMEPPKERVIHPPLPGGIKGASELSDDALELATWFDLLTEPTDRTTAHNVAMAKILKLMADRAALRVSQSTALLIRSENQEKQHE